MTSKKNSRFYISFFLLLVVILGANPYIQGYRPFPKTLHKKQPESMEMDSSNNVTPLKSTLDQEKAAAASNNAPIIAEPPIPMDPATADHLKSFRQQGESLALQYPDQFMVKGPADKKVIALTFDDGPDAIFTPQILDILNKEKIKATFFLIGEKIARYPEVVKRMADEGHNIGNHSWSHPRLEQAALSEVKQEIQQTENAVRNITGQSPVLIRPPYGLMTKSQISYFADKGCRIIDWSIDSMDWYTQDDQLVFDAVTKVIHNGAIILMHSAEGKDGRGGTIKALQRFIPYLKNKGYAFTTVQDLLKNASP